MKILIFLCGVSNSDGLIPKHPFCQDLKFNIFASLHMSVNSPLIHFLTIGSKDAILFEGFIGSVEFDANNNTVMA